MSGRCVVVAGGAGFLGSHLCDQLIDRGDEVIFVDDLSSGRRSNIAHLIGHVRYRFVEHDVTVAGLADLIEGDLSAVMHLASPASPPDYLRRPLETLAVNSVGSHQLLELAMAKNAKFFLASTSEVYGDPLEHPQHESYWGNVNPVGDRSVYDEAKRFAEALTMAYHRTNGVDVRVVRIFNTYGPRMSAHDGRVVSNFISQALSDQPLTVYGDGSQTRSFCFIDDEVDGLLRLLDGPHVGPINIGNPNEFTIAQLADLVVELTGSDSEIVFRDLPSDDPKVRCPNISAARELLGWSPTVELRAGLERTVEWFRNTDDAR